MKKSIYLWTTILLFGGTMTKCEGPGDNTSVKRPKKDNIDSLIAILKKDTVFHIKSVVYNSKDSDIRIIISDKEYSTKYFNDTYHLNDFQSIDGIILLDRHNKELTSDSRRGGRILSAFKDKFCVGNICLPLRDKIKETMNDPGSYESDQLWTEWSGDSLITITNSFRGKNAFGAQILNKVQATMDMSGNVIDIKEAN